MTNGGTNRLGSSFHEHDEDELGQRELIGPLSRRALFIVALVLVTACGEAPLQSVGLRSSEWINEPTVPTTQPVMTTPPTAVPTDRLIWANDEIENDNVDDREALLAAVFSRRQGDRFIQASRFEIAVALPDVRFPEEAPIGAEWVSSQLVFDNDGSLAADTTAAFGIWSAEPYTRSRTVAQMVILRVAIDPETADEVASGEGEASCARFSDRNTDRCEIVTIGDRETWVLGGSSGSTLIWFDSPYRYELYGRAFVSDSALHDMSDRMVPLDSIG